MADFFRRVTESQGTVEDLVRRLPGFKGYFDRQDRRAADRLLRGHLVRVFEEQLGEFTRLQKELVGTGGIVYMEHARTIDARLRMFVDRIESAAQGYAGLFDAVKIREAELARVYAFDSALLAYQGQFTEGLERLREVVGTDQVDAVLSQLDGIVTEANNAFRLRVEAMQGLQDPG